MRRTDDSVTASAAPASDVPDRIEPVSTTLAGNAQTMPTMKTVWAMVSPDSRASPAKPTKAAMRMMPGIDHAARTPRSTQMRSGPPSSRREGESAGVGSVMMTRR